MTAPDGSARSTRFAGPAGRTRPSRSTPGAASSGWWGPPRRWPAPPQPELGASDPDLRPPVSCGQGAIPHLDGAAVPDPVGQPAHRRASGCEVGRRALRSAGAAATAWVVRPSFEGPFFSRLEELSAALVRSWMRALSVGTFYQVDGGMDSPWRHLGERLGVRTGATVERVAPRAGGVEIVVDGVAETYDGAVVAVPAPVAARIVARKPFRQRSRTSSTPRTSGCTWHDRASVRRAPGSMRSRTRRSPRSSWGLEGTGRGAASRSWLGVGAHLRPGGLERSLAGAAR